MSNRSAWVDSFHLERDLRILPAHTSAKLQGVHNFRLPTHGLRTLAVVGAIDIRLTLRVLHHYGTMSLELAILGILE